MRGMENILLFSLIVMRITGFIVFNPILGRRNAPAIVKMGIVMALSIIAVSYNGQAPVEAANALEYSFLLLKEFFLGFVIGTVVNLFLNIIVFAGESIDMQMGLSMSKIFDASSNAQLSLSATFFNIVFILLFFASDAHLALIRMLLTSGEVVPYGSVIITSGLSSAVLTVFCDCKALAVRMAMPMLAAEILVEVGVGILMKTIPQINVFVVNIQAKIIFGLILLVFLFTPMAGFLDGVIEDMFKVLQEILTLM